MRGLKDLGDAVPNPLQGAYPLTQLPAAQERGWGIGGRRCKVQGDASRMARFSDGKKYSIDAVQQGGYEDCGGKAKEQGALHQELCKGHFSVPLRSAQSGCLLDTLRPLTRLPTSYNAAGGRFEGAGFGEMQKGFWKNSTTRKRAAGKVLGQALFKGIAGIRGQRN